MANPKIIVYFCTINLTGIWTNTRKDLKNVEYG